MGDFSTVFSFSYAQIPYKKMLSAQSSDRHRSEPKYRRNIFKIPDNADGNRAFEEKSMQLYQGSKMPIGPNVLLTTGSE